MQNPYEPSGEPIDLPTSVETPISPLRRLGYFLLFACGCVTGVHVVVGTTEGPSVAFQRTMASPVDALTFFAGISLGSYLATGAWRIIRRRILGSYSSSAIARFATGIAMAILYAGVYTILRTISRKIVEPGTIMSTVLPNLTTFLAVGISAILSIEIEAIAVQLLPRVSARENTPRD